VRTGACLAKRPRCPIEDAITTMAGQPTPTVAHATTSERCRRVVVGRVGDRPGSSSRAGHVPVHRRTSGFECAMCGVGLEVLHSLRSAHPWLLAGRVTTNPPRAEPKPNRIE
jgi:hypothetical protein